MRTLLLNTPWLFLTGYGFDWTYFGTKLVYNCNELNYFTLVSIEYHIMDIYSVNNPKWRCLARYNTLGIQHRD
jgi:hypothetical protein